MASSKRVSIIACLAVIALSSSSFIPQQQKINNPNNGFAVVELFTSEGCSSCPPADALIAKIEKESNNQSVLILAYHVDYWNRLGWKDVFSSHAFSERQNLYSHWLKLNGVYTPQVVVNGQKEFIGSNEVSLRNAIKSGLQNGSAGALNLSNIKTMNHQVELQYQADRLNSSSVLVLVIVQKKAITQVKSGENGGRTLSHVQIVRTIKTIVMDGKNRGNTTIGLPAGLSLQGLELIAFLQNNNTGEITAAAQSKLPSANELVQVNSR